MNEVNQIHLGRQAFTISVEAHKELRSYLDAIQKQVGDKDVVEEVELRMAELLTEHGISGKKVVLSADVEFLKEQLGNPKDFKEDDDGESSADKPADTKRLFRDTEGAMVAGVASGLSKYLGVDVLLIRILFVIGIFTGGWGILIYIVLWLLVPEAKTSSDRLQMAGKPVTVDSLKQVVERADVGGAARRANSSLAGPINAFFRAVLRIAGIVFVVSGLSMLFGLIGAGIYMWLHTGTLLPDNIFPVGLREHLLVDITMTVLGIIALFIVLFGMAMYKRKWPIRTWITGMLIGLAFIGVAAGGALAADVYPTVRDRYNADVHTTVRPMQPFTTVDSVGEGVNINYRISDKYSISMNYFDHPDINTIKTTVQNGALLIDSTQFNWHHDCNGLCIPDLYNVTVTVNSPNAPPIDKPESPFPPFPPKPMYP